VDANKYITAYTIDDDGMIDIPVIGKMKAGGLTRLELERPFRASCVRIC
jgi:protein involved in polysaccharide export with SLBB domain